MVSLWSSAFSHLYFGKQTIVPDSNAVLHTHTEMDVENSLYIYFYRSDYIIPQISPNILILIKKECCGKMKTKGWDYSH